VTLSLRGSVLGAFCLLIGALCLVGSLAVNASVRSAQQASTFEQGSVVPVVGLSALTQNVDQERDLLNADITHMKPDRRRAIEDELQSLDLSTARSASRILLPAERPPWQAAWDRYVGVRTLFMRRLLAGSVRSVSPALRTSLSDRLAAVLDVLQSDAGTHLYQGQRLYVSSVARDWMLIRLTGLGVGVAILLAFGFAVLIVRRLTAGLRNLTRTAVAITQGNLELRAEATGHDELAVVARTFNHMTDALLQLERTALTDPLTGLGNHRAFHEEFQRELARAARHGQRLSMALIDLDDFKLVNDKHGHAHGDQVLAAFAACLRRTRVEDRPFRIGGDEFALLLPYASASEAETLLERLRQTVETTLPGVTVSIGIAELDEEVEDAETLREQADAALYESKRRGRNTIVGFDSIRAHASIVSPAKLHAVRRLIADRSFAFAFQPIMELESGNILGYEALMRPQRESGLSSPQEVFDIAEKLGRAPELDRLCFQAILARAGELPAGTLLFINLSPQSLDHGAFSSSDLLATLQAAGMSPSRIVFEITERSVARADIVVREARRLHELGFLLALDDVGAGNAGLDMLRRVTVDFVKIDRSVIAQALIDDSAAAVLSGIIAFARHARTFVIAEGIETRAMLDIIREAGMPDPATQGGVQGVQGYLFGRPSEVIVDRLPDDALPRTDIHEEQVQPGDGVVVPFGELKARQRADAAPAQREEAG